LKLFNAHIRFNDYEGRGNSRKSVKVMKRSSIMSPVDTGKVRRNLLHGIFHVLQLWPELHRRIFTEVHYGGQSAEALSLALNMDVTEVNEILKHCDRELHIALRGFRMSGCGQPSQITATTARTVTSRRGWKNRALRVLNPCPNFNAV
jgi:hypothetical protein